MLLASGPIQKEFGWRGYALDRPQVTRGALGASLLLGGVWALWHLPLHFLPGATQATLPIWQFWLITIVGSAFYTWIHNHTGGGDRARRGPGVAVARRRRRPHVTGGTAPVAQSTNVRISSTTAPAIAATTSVWRN
jgi:hypothetical protein